jgi:hypothetical protein
MAVNVVGRQFRGAQHPGERELRESHDEPRRREQDLPIFVRNESARACEPVECVCNHVDKRLQVPCGCAT